MTQLTLGYPTTCYGMVRLSHGLPLAQYGAHYRKVRRIPLHRLPFAPAYWNYVASVLPGSRVDALHTFNRVCVGSIPWVCSFEMEYPRYFGAVPRRAFRQAYDRMARDECRLLLPMSEAARQHFLCRVPDGYLRDIEPKVHVFTGGVSVPEAALNRRKSYLNEKRAFFRVGFIGGAFWRKGGSALVCAAKKLRRQQYDVRLLVVGDIEDTRVYGGSIFREHGIGLARELKGESWVEWHRGLPNSQALEKLAECDVLGFPTLDESLGWVVIEALALGLPILTTNVFAIPELMQDGVHGRICELALDKDRRWTGLSALGLSDCRGYSELQKMLAEWLAGAIEALIDDPAACRQFGLAARRRFEERYQDSLAAGNLAMLLRQHL